MRMTRNFAPIDIYFHMSNHYRKLKCVKSVVDTSAPLGFNEKSQSNKQSRPPSRTGAQRESPIYNTNWFCSNSTCTIRGSVVKHENRSTVRCTYSARSQSLPLRPPTRRKPSDMPVVSQRTSRTQSSGPSERASNSSQKPRSSRSRRSSSAIGSDYTHSLESPKVVTKNASNQSTIKPIPAPRAKKSKKGDCNKHNVSEHEYLRFSLRITEDIIRNDLYTNTEMRRVFNSHLEANRGRLNMDRMIQQIESLCYELNIPPDDSQDDDEITRSQIKMIRQTTKTALSCVCCPVARPPNFEAKDCECSAVRHLPLVCSQNRECNELAEANQNDEEVIETHYYEQPESVLQSISDLRLLEEQDTVDNIKLNEDELVRALGPSEHCLLLPSLSCVIEKTEPGTSCETINSIHLNTEASGNELIEVEKTEEQNNANEKDSNESTKTSTRRLSFGSNTVQLVSPRESTLNNTLRPPNLNENTLQQCAVGTPDSIKFCCLSIESPELSSNEGEKIQINNLCVQPLIKSVQEEYSSTSVVRDVTHCKNTSSPESSLVKSQDVSNKALCNCDTTIPQFEVMEMPESHNIKICKPNNLEEEYVLIPGPIYIPKVCVKHLQSGNMQNVSIIAPEVLIKRRAISEQEPVEIKKSKDEKSTPQHVHSVSQEFSNKSCYSYFSQATTYSQMHEKALATAHYPSLQSNISEVPSIPQAPSISEAKLLKANIHASPKRIPKQQNEHNLLAELNDYDLTPQRDNEPDDKKKNLLLGDEYEIKNSYEYNTSLPLSICQFYPNNSTQTQSSDWLASPTSPPETVSESISAKCSSLLMPSPNKSVELIHEPFDSLLEMLGNASFSREEVEEKLNVLSSLSSDVLLRTEKPKNVHGSYSFDSYIKKEPLEDIMKKLELAEKSSSKTLFFKKESLGNIIKKLESVEKTLPRTQFDKKESLDNEEKYWEWMNTNSFTAEEFINLIEKKELGDEPSAIKIKKPVTIKNPVESRSDLFNKLDHTPSSLASSSMQLTIKQVTNDLEKLRQIKPSPEAPVLQQFRACEPPKVAEHSEQLTTVHLNDSDLTSLDRSVSSVGQVKRKEVASSDSYTICCGLKKGKMRKRRDLVEIEERAQDIPNISSIAEDQLHMPDVGPPTASDVNTKSLVFDYSERSSSSDNKIPNVPSDDEARSNVDKHETAVTFNINGAPRNDGSLIEILSLKEVASAESLQMIQPPADSDVNIDVAYL